MWNSNHHYNLLQQGAGNYDDSEVSNFQKAKSLKLAAEWSLPKKKQKHHETQINTLINQYEENRDAENVACIKAQNALPVYRKQLRKVLLEYLQWMRAMKKGPSEK